MCARPNRSERVLLALAEESDGGAELFEGLEEGSRRALFGDSSRDAGPLERLAEQPPADFTRFAESVGLCAVARLLVERASGTPQNLGDTFAPRARDDFERWLRHWGEVAERDSDEASDVDRRTLRRIVESFANFQERATELMEAVRELGLLVVASAAGYRCRACFERLTERLSGEASARLNDYYRTAYLSRRRNTGPGFRRLLAVVCDAPIEDEEQKSRERGNRE